MITRCCRDMSTHFAVSRDAVTKPLNIAYDVRARSPATQMSLVKPHGRSRSSWRGKPGGMH